MCVLVGCLVAWLVGRSVGPGWRSEVHGLHQLRLPFGAYSEALLRANPRDFERWGFQGGGGGSRGFLSSPGLRTVPFSPFLGEGSPTKIDYRKVGTLIPTSLLEDLVVDGRSKRLFF